MQKESIPQVSVITVNYNQPNFTLELLHSLQNISFQSIEIIVIDNGSSFNPEQLFKNAFPNITFLRSKKNLGFAGGNNLGVKASKGNYLFFINNDARVTEGAIDQLINIFSKVSNLGIVSPLICFDPSIINGNTDIIQFAGATKVHPITGRNKTIGRMEVDRNQYNKPYPIAYVHGAAMMIPRSVLYEVGLMKEDYFLYYEELDWCERICKAGYQIYLEPRAKIYHAESVSTGKKSPLKTFYLTRNRILFIRRNYSIFALIGFSIFLIVFTIPKNIVYYLIKGDLKNAKAFWNGIVWNLNNNRL